ncbi:cytochrome P450 [Curvularia clavata]|uniref:Cytochrome P450 n=1 Tax=Curvularia clavata TaxID=95742 RepID=A0A9Q8Z9A3_CURCL|nr:cytochrome P450 [Curvularia clavata]
MYSLRDTLLSPSPKGPSDITKLDDAAHDRQDTCESIARGHIETVRLAGFTNRTWIISERYCALGDGVDSLEGYLRSIWHIYYQLSRHASYETSDQDRLVLDIVRIQGLGPLTRPVSGNYGIDIARTVQGTLWNDLPFLATDMTDFWIKNCSSLSSAHRLNFASFLAKLASTRVCNDRICQIALILFRSTFEETRQLCSMEHEKKDEEDASRTMHDLAVADLLPAACAWINEAKYCLLQLSDVFWNDCPSAVGAGGKDFVESELGMRSPTGFTPWRWMYWLKRLHRIRDEAHVAHEGHLEKQATDAIEWMVNAVKERNSEVLRAYQKGGPDLQQDPQLRCLAPEFPEAK